MKPVNQTIYGTPCGNCFAACVASILELELEEVPNFVAAEKNWFDVLNAFMASFRLYPLFLQGKSAFTPLGNYIVSGKSPRDPKILHSVVYNSGVMVHDPHPSRSGIGEVYDMCIFVYIM